MIENYSVLMSLYEKEVPTYFRQSVESMLNQTIPPEQIIIVLDGPITNELDEIVKYYSYKYPSIFTIVPLKKNIGLGLALNEGLKVSRNNIVARMDTDDISFKERCEKQLRAMSQNPELTIVGTWTSEFEDDHLSPFSSREVPEKHDDIIRFSKRRSPFNHPTVMYRNNHILELGGYNDILRNEDYDLFYRLLNAGYQGENLPEKLLHFRSNKDSYLRRKSWVNCKGYISVSSKMRKERFISMFDYIFVVCSQVTFFVLPAPAIKYISDKYLRGN